MAYQRLTIFHIEVPLLRPFSIAGGSVRSRSVALVRFGEGPVGWGEAAPYPGQDESVESVVTAARRGGSTPTLQAAIDEAVSDHDARLLDTPLSGGIGDTRGIIPVSVAVGLADPLEAVDRAADEGVARFKLKIEPGVIDHVSEIRSRYADAVIGLDANGSFDADTVGELEPLGELDISYVEQPVADLTSDAAQTLARMAIAPIFADEAIRSVEDVHTVLGLGHVAGVVVKPGRLGWTGALAARAAATSAGKMWRASGLLETGLGRAYTDILAACTDAFISDVAPAEWFLEDGIVPSRFADGDILVPSRPGVGVDPSPDAIERYLVESFDFSE